MAHIPLTVQSFPIPGLTRLHQGKVRDTYALPGHPGLLLVFASDRISIFDFVLAAFVFGKGEILTALNIWWCSEVLNGVFPSDLVAFGRNIDEYLPVVAQGNTQLWRRAVVVHKLDMVPIEAIVRGYLTGSGLVSYRENGVVCGHWLPAGLSDGSRLPRSLFTPSTKAEVGHDEPLDVAAVRAQFGTEPEELALRIYEMARRVTEAQNVLVADTKFEFGRDTEGNFVVGDERLTPDSSRFWDADDWRRALREGRTPTPFDKQFVREWGKTFGIHKYDPRKEADLAWVSGLSVPVDVRAKTTMIYEKIFTRLTGRTLSTFQQTVMGIAA